MAPPRGFCYPLLAIHCLNHYFSFKLNAPPDCATATISAWPIAYLAHASHLHLFCVLKTVLRLRFVERASSGMEHAQPPFFVLSCFASVIFRFWCTRISLVANH